MVYKQTNITLGFSVVTMLYNRLRKYTNGAAAQVANMNCEGMEDILESAVPEISAAVKSILRSGVNSWHGCTWCTQLIRIHTYIVVNMHLMHICMICIVIYIYVKYRNCCICIDHIYIHMVSLYFYSMVCFSGEHFPAWTSPMYGDGPRMSKNL